MKKVYKKIIDFLYKNYTGLISYKIGKYEVYSVKPYILIFVIFWGILKLIQSLVFGFVFWAWWDYILITLFIPQIIAGFSMIIVNEYKKLNNKNE
jgi:hypothetical protein